MPFILRGVRLIGIDSSQCPMPEREAAWRKLAALLPDGLPGDAVSTCGLADLPRLAEAIVAGKVRGRTLVDVRR
jgi:acrylyl-CoA reductase (NADPH)